MQHQKTGILPPTERVAKLVEEYLIPVIIAHIRDGKIKPNMDYNSAENS